MDFIAKHIIFTGRVQGVGFRFTALSLANSHQLQGQVKNLPNGSVDMIVQGGPSEIDDCIEELKNRFGQNIKTQITQIPVNPNFDDFRITF